MSKKKEIFGKDTGLAISDIEKALESQMLYENDEIEFKNIDRMEKKDRPGKIVGELISFLNSGQGRGLLILGIDDDKTIKGVKSIKSREQLRSLIFQGIKSLPSAINPVKLDISSIPYKDAQIFLVEIKSNELNYVYYSGYDNQAYIRRGDEAKKLSISEFLEFLSNKTHARIFLKLKEKTSDKDSYIFDINLINKGNEPGMHVTAKLNIITKPDLVYSTSNLKKNDVQKNINIGFVDDNDGDYPFKIGDNINSSVFIGVAGFIPNTIPLYPNILSKIGEITIKRRDFKMVVQTDIYEKKGQTRQSIYIKSKNGKIIINYAFKEYKSYLNL